MAGVRTARRPRANRPDRVMMAIDLRVMTARRAASGVGVSPKALCWWPITVTTRLRSSGEPAHRRLGERDRDGLPPEIDDRCDPVGRECDAAPRNMRDKEQTHQPCPPIAVVVAARRNGGTTGPRSSVARSPDRAAGHSDNAAAAAPAPGNDCAGA